MAYSDIAAKTLLVNVLANVTVSDNTAQVGTVVDMLGFGALMFDTNIGALVDADATFTALVEDADDFAFTQNVETVAAENLIGSGDFQFDSDTTGSKCRRVGYIGKKRFVRYKITPAANASAADFSVTAVLATPIKAATEVNA